MERESETEAISRGKRGSSMFRVRVLSGVVMVVGELMAVKKKERARGDMGSLGK